MMKKNTNESFVNELESARMEFMRIRFRKVLGESISSHVIKSARKNVAKCVRLLESDEVKGA